MRVLVIDPDKARAALVAEGLADVKPLEVRSAPSFEAIEAELEAFAPDVIVIACDSPDRDTLENLRQRTAHNPRPVWPTPPSRPASPPMWWTACRPSACARCWRWP